MARSAFALAALAATALVAAPSPARAAPGVSCGFYGINPGAPVGNGQVVLDADYADRLAASGAGAVRIDFRLDGAASWDAAKLAQYDGIVDAAIAAGLQPLGLLAYEGAPGTQADWNDDADGDGYNDYVAAFAATSEVLIGHFAGRIRRWEIWSEPNCWTNPDYQLDPQAAGCTYLLPRVFAAMLSEVYLRSEPLIKLGQVSLISGGLLAHDSGGAYAPGLDYIDEVYTLGVWDTFEANAGRRYPWDQLGYHLYVDQEVVADEVTTTSYLDAVRDQAALRGDQAPFAVTEIGWTTLSVTEEVQAANLTTAYALLSARPDVAAAYWFSYRDAPADDLYFGLATDTDAPKAALGAMQAAAEGCVPENGGSGGGGGSGAGSTAAAGPIGGPAGGSTTAPPRGPAQEDSCSCAAAGAGRRDPEGALLLIIAGAALALRSLTWRARGERRPRR